jgi:hypothetical protein
MEPLSAVIHLLVKGGVKAIALYLNHKASNQFLDEIKVLFTRLTQQGYLETLLPPLGTSPDNSQTRVGWVITDKGTEMFAEVYCDIALALERFGMPFEKIDAMGLRRRLMVNINSTSKGNDIQSRLGATWPAEYQEDLLKTSNPFKHLPAMQNKDKGRHALGMVGKALRSPEHKDLLLKRILALAQFCGLSEISLSDLIELMAHACHYEKLMRRYVAAGIGIHHSFITNLAFGDFGGQPLGSTENPDHDFTQLVPRFWGGFVQVGVIRGGKAQVTYPSPGEELKNVRIKVDMSAHAKENEPVFMVPGWATAIFHRPDHPRVRSMTKDLTVGVLRETGYAFIPNFVVSKIEGKRQNIYAHDIHGNALYFSLELEYIYINIKRVADGRLVAKMSELGDWRPSAFPGQGVFGVPCRCQRPDPKKIIRDRRFNGCPLRDVFHYKYSNQNLFVGYETTQYHWVGGDLPMILFRADSIVMNTYIQMRGECLYCATSRALGTRCSLIISGGWS